MELQTKLGFKKEIEDLKPEIRVTRNTFMTAGAIVREEVIKKTWIIPTEHIVT